MPDLGGKDASSDLLSRLCGVLHVRLMPDQGFLAQLPTIASVVSVYPVEYAARDAVQNAK